MTEEEKQEFIRKLKENRKERIRLRKKEYRRKWNKANPVRAREVIRNWRQANPERHRNTARKANLKMYYNLTMEEYNGILSRQENKCAGCGINTPGGRGWVVDHCHKTRKIRGILCNHCNLGIGHAKDNIAILEKWIAYLQR